MKESEARALVAELTEEEKVELSALIASLRQNHERAESHPH